MPKPEKTVAEVMDPSGQALVDINTFDPAYHYRFVHSRPQRVARMRHRGYEPVLASQDGVIPLVEGMIGADDLIHDGDTILMKVPREKFERGRQKLQLLNRSRVAAPKAQFRKKTAGAGPGGEDVRVVTEDKHDREG